MISQDKLEKERIDSKNAVEEYVYDTREKLSGRLEGFIKEKVSYDISLPISQFLFHHFFLSFLICTLSSKDAAIP